MHHPAERGASLPRTATPIKAECPRKRGIDNPPDQWPGGTGEKNRRLEYRSRGVETVIAGGIAKKKKKKSKIRKLKKTTRTGNSRKRLRGGAEGKNW